MSVTERYRDIGTMKCLGALNTFITSLILLESSFLGATGAMVGIVVGGLFAVLGYSSTYDMKAVVETVNPMALLASGSICVLLGSVVAVMAAIYPARVAARMVPADALRTDI